MKTSCCLIKEVKSSFCLIKMKTSYTLIKVKTSCCLIKVKTSCTLIKENLMFLEIKRYCFNHFMLNINSLTILFCIPIGVVGNLTHLKFKLKNFWFLTFLVLRGYVVTCLRICYCIINCTPFKLITPFFQVITIKL